MTWPILVALAINVGLFALLLWKRPGRRSHRAFWWWAVAVDITTFGWNLVSFFLQAQVAGWTITI